MNETEGILFLTLHYVRVSSKKFLLQISGVILVKSDHKIPVRTLKEQIIFSSQVFQKAKVLMF